ncbi:MAG: hypothetical protein PHU12_01180 [Candidatus Aenigmarchaeota archaeon]|nr:hypothetical protein [Candidatus Aenigmarchaeota archaeon]
MSKGMSQLVVMIILLLIGISMAGLLYVWAPQVVKDIYPEQAQDTQYFRSRACLGIQNITSDSITINNCGSIPLENFNVYLNGINQNMDIQKLNPGNNYTIPVTVTSPADVQITSNYAETPVIKYIAS